MRAPLSLVNIAIAIGRTKPLSRLGLFGSNPTAAHDAVRFYLKQIGEVAANRDLKQKASRPEEEKMLRLRLPLMFIAVSALWALAAHAEDRLLLKPVNVDLPFGDRVFEGPGSDVANNNCLAPIDPKDVDTIVACLVSIRGAK
jgi:hypothetical protein